MEHQHQALLAFKSSGVAMLRKVVAFLRSSDITITLPKLAVVDPAGANQLG
jgi:hypothetical protein